MLRAGVGGAPLVFDPVGERPRAEHAGEGGATAQETEVDHIVGRRVII